MAETTETETGAAQDEPRATLEETPSSAPVPEDAGAASGDPGEASAGPGEHEAALEAAWSNADWADDQAHTKFIALCASLGRLDFAGRRYREVKESEPHRAELADARIEKLIVHAMQTLEFGRQPPESEKLRKPVLVLGYLIALVLIGLTIYIVTR